MARAAVYDAILADQRLIDLGFDKSSVLVNYDGDQRPTDTMFMVLSWGNETPGVQGDDVFSIPTKNLNVWVHMYKQFSTDFVRIDDVLDILDDVLGSMINVDGADGYTLSQAIPNNRSRDLRDDAYQTLCRSTSYKIIDNVTTATV
jgi:hypothetical protein